MLLVEVWGLHTSRGGRGPSWTSRDVGREFRHREVSLPPRHFGFTTSGAPSRWGGSSERLQ